MCRTTAEPPAPRQLSRIEQVTKRKALLAQCLMNFAVILLVVGSSMPIGFSAVLLPQLQSEESSLPTDDSWASWIASVHSTMTPVGALLAGPLMDRWGRRRTLQLSVGPLIAGWALISVAPTHSCLIAGRMLAGFAVGMTTGPSQVLIGEISEPQLRGAFASGAGLAYAMGILSVYVLGSLLPWRIVAALSTVLPITSLLMLSTMPESPVWLVIQGNTDEARKSLLRLRGGDNNKANQELHTLVSHYKAEQDRMATEERSSCNSLFQQTCCLARPEVLKPFFIILTFCILQILSGSYIVIFYSISLISSASGCPEDDINNVTVAIMTALVRVVMSLVTTVSLFKFGRRKIGVISGIGTAFACLMLVGYLILKKFHIVNLDYHYNSAVIGSLIMVYVALNTFGIFSLPCMMMSEVLPSTVRGFVSGILLTTINLIIFSTTKLYPYIAKILGPGGVFFCFAIVSIITTVYVYLFLPETKDRPLTQIEQYFATGKNYLWATRDKTLMAKNNNLF